MEDNKQCKVNANGTRTMEIKAAAKRGMPGGNWGLEKGGKKCTGGASGGLGGKKPRGTRR